MGNIQLSSFVNLPMLSSGRAIFALKQVVPHAATARNERIGQQADVALTSAQSTRDLEFRYRQPKPRPLHGPGAAAGDAKLDRGVSAFADILRSVAAVFTEVDPRVIAAARIDSAIFPKGVGAITSQSFVEEHETMNVALGRLGEDGDLAGDVAKLGLTAHVARLRELNTAFGKELGAATPQAKPTWDEVRAARATTHAAMEKLVAMICGTFCEDDDTSITQRNRLLGPIVAQLEQVSERRRNRSAAPDVDPDTGQETTEPTDEPTAPPT